MSEKIKIQIEVDKYTNAAELVEQDADLLEQARAAVGNAYAPYSHFYVGVAVRLINGEVVLGNNQENVAYNVGLCGERVALFSAGANYPNEAVEALAVVAKSDAVDLNGPVTPCGACRQAIAEWESRHSQPIRIIMQGEHGPVYVVQGIKQLLPLLFNEPGLKKE